MENDLDSILQVTWRRNTPEFEHNSCIHQSTKNIFLKKKTIQILYLKL